MHLRKLSLFNFRSYSTSDFEFSEGINCIVGGNGSGKTNLLDAIHFLSLTKSSISNIDQENIKHGNDTFIIRGEFQNDRRMDSVKCKVERAKRKDFFFNELVYDRLSDHIGKLPLILMTPNDSELIRGGSDVRRKLIDNILSQSNHEYLEDYLKYNKVLKQRNAALKRMFLTNRTDDTLLDAYDEELLTVGLKLYYVRSNFLNEFLSVFIERYDMISGGSENVTIGYKSDCESISFKTEFRRSREQDIRLQRTCLGIHRDDYIFMLDNSRIKQFGSQGQQKSFVLALKISQADIIKKQSGNLPLILMDDIFDKLDDFRIQRLLSYVVETGGQVFITDARPDRTKELLRKNKIEAEYTFINKEIE
ncbi:MAG: DNA replication and repair protein RecF [Cyclobacteriaceae bacterium]|nr:DNA replication and repair protein RecF [Cyclobacteriaceae bacterium]